MIRYYVDSIRSFGALNLVSNVSQVKEVLTAMKADAGNIEVMVGGEFILRVDGGATVNSLLMQLQVLIEV